MNFARSHPRVLLSEGSSLSARQAITALGQAGYRIGVCDSNPACLGRFSRFTARFYRCPPFGGDPWAYLDAVAAVLSTGDWDVLFPVHEQAFLFARERGRIPPGIGCALADFDSFLAVQGKAALVRTLTRLSIPQPASRVAANRSEILEQRRFPFYLKADYATASTAVWLIRTAADLEPLNIEGQTPWVVQEPVSGALERVQSVFDGGRLVALAGYRQVAAGPGGGDIAKSSVDRPGVRGYVEQLGAALHWHGALSLDYMVDPKTGAPFFIDANPRLVEPMNGLFAGVNLADTLVRISLGERVTAAPPALPGVRTHMLLMALLSQAGRTGRRRAVAAELLSAALRRGIYSGSREELLPWHSDYQCLGALIYALARLLIHPQSARSLTAGSIAAYSLTPAAAREIQKSAPASYRRPVTPA